MTEQAGRQVGKRAHHID